MKMASSLNRQRRSQSSRQTNRQRLAKALFDKKPNRRASAAKIISAWDWIFLPALLSLLATLIMATNIPLPFGLDLPEPIWPMVLAFSWPLIRPSYLAPLVLAALGLCLEYFWNAPLGLYVLSLMVVYGGTLLIRSYIVGQDLAVVLVAYLIACFVFFAIATLLTTIDSGMVPRLISVFEQWFATGFLVIFVHALLSRYLHAEVRFN
jgi:rod shape-determining protein MreD